MHNIDQNMNQLNLPTTAGGRGALPVYVQQSVSGVVKRPIDEAAFKDLVGQCESNLRWISFWKGFKKLAVPLSIVGVGIPFLLFGIYKKGKQLDKLGYRLAVVDGAIRNAAVPDNQKEILTALQKKMDKAAWHATRSLDSQIDAYKGKIHSEEEKLSDEGDFGRSYNKMVRTGKRQWAEDVQNSEARYGAHTYADKVKDTSNEAFAERAQTVPRPQNTSRTAASGSGVALSGNEAAVCCNLLLELLTCCF